MLEVGFFEMFIQYFPEDGCRIILSNVDKELFFPKIEKVRFSKILLKINQATLRHIPKDNIIYSYYRVKFKSYKRSGRYLKMKIGKLFFRKNLHKHEATSKMLFGILGRSYGAVPVHFFFTR